MIALLAIEDDDDRAYMTQLYLKHASLMYSVAYFYMEDHQDAQDVVNDAVVKLIGKIALLRLKDGAVVRSYIVSAVRRTALNALKRRQRKRLVTRFLGDGALEEIPDEGTAVDADAIARATHEELLAVLDQLPERERNLLLWKYFDGCTDEEIASLTGISKASVRAYLTRARRHMYALLERQGIHHA